MTTDLDQRIRAYVDSVPVAVSGNNGHGATINLAMKLIHGFCLPIDMARPYFTDWARRCDPPWSEREIEYKLQEAEKMTDTRGDGYLLKPSYIFMDRTGAGKKVPYQPVRSPAAESKPSTRRYETDQSLKMPGPIPDGTRALLKAAFIHGEGVRLCHAMDNDEGREVPENSGVVLSREEWLAKLDKYGGDPNKFFDRMTPTGLNGIFVSLNPMKLGGGRDSDVTAFRHALIEFDNISIEEQWSLIVQSQIPCAAVIFSGARSLHAWVKVDAKDAKEYAERVRFLYAHFEEQQRPDEKNKNPSRFSRLAGCERKGNRQELIALAIGAESYTVWTAELERETLGKGKNCDDLRKRSLLPPENDLLGRGWLRRGGSCLIVGETGIGKSSISVHLAYTWALGQAAYGITPGRPLKSLIIQAENDEDDLAEMSEGVIKSLGIIDDPESFDLIRENVIFETETSSTGEEFLRRIHRLIDRDRPDLVWIDPLLSFIGDDISKQSVCAKFLRAGLNPISSATGVCWIAMHHTGKPPSQNGKWNKNQADDGNYAGMGSSELMNWARAICYLGRTKSKPDVFKFKLGKRGNRTGARSFDGQPTDTIYLKHAEIGIGWEQVAEPPPPKSRFSGPKSSKPKSDSASDPYEPDPEEEEKGLIVSFLALMESKPSMTATDIVTEEIAPLWKCSSRTAWDKWKKLKPQFTENPETKQFRVTETL